MNFDETYMSVIEAKTVDEVRDRSLKIIKSVVCLYAGQARKPDKTVPSHKKKIRRKYYKSKKRNI